MKAADVEAALRRRYLQELTGWALLREVTIDDAVAVEAWTSASINWRTPGAVDPELLTARTRRIDVLLMRTAPSAKPAYERIAVEIKVTRGDFLRDTELKRRAWQAVAHRFAYATPAGLIRPDEVPPGCGLIEVDRVDTGWPLSGVNWRVRAPKRDGAPDAFTDRFVAYLAGRASRAEHDLRKAAR